MTEEKLMSAPKRSRLEPEYKIEGVSSQSRERFFELARSRVKLVSEEEQRRFQKEVHGTVYRDAPAMFIAGYEDKEVRSLLKSFKSFLSTLVTGRIDIDKEFERWVSTLEISVNTDAFIKDDIDYLDLIPYVIEHEIYEAYLVVKRGYKPKDIHTNHLLARRREYEMAAQDGKLDRLFEFHKSIAAPSLHEELQNAYDHAKSGIEAMK